MLTIHGTDDVWVPYEQAKILDEKLKDKWEKLYKSYADFYKKYEDGKLYITSYALDDERKLLYKKKTYIKVQGQNRLHYSPGIPLRMNCKEASLDEAFILVKKRGNSNKNFFYLSKNKNLKEAARNLYSVLRMINA